MVHKAFREALGDTATQAGSENSPGRFRFDFSATGSVPTSVMADVEARVNDLVLADLAVHAEVMTQDEARKSGAMALFGEKYGDQVRVVSVGDWARELCGGTHARRSGQLGLVKILGESSIGAGVRRVEALVGVDAYQFLAREHALVALLGAGGMLAFEPAAESPGGFSSYADALWRDHCAPHGPTGTGHLLNYASRACKPAGSTTQGNGMNASMILYTNSLYSSPYALSVYATLVEKGLPFELMTIDLASGEIVGAGPGAPVHEAGGRQAQARRHARAQPPRGGAVCGRRPRGRSR